MSTTLIVNIRQIKHETLMNNLALNMRVRFTGECLREEEYETTAVGRVVIGSSYDSTNDLDNILLCEKAYRLSNLWHTEQKDYSVVNMEQHGIRSQVTCFVDGIQMFIFNNSYSMSVGDIIEIIDPDMRDNTLLYICKPSGWEKIQKDDPAYEEVTVTSSVI